MNKYLIIGLLLLCAHSNATTLNPADIAKAAELRTKSLVIYNGAYYDIDYPMGDVPSHIGVCTDVVIRTFRALGVDLQEEVHKDMAAFFDQYPSARIWGMKRPDHNIDHRRVPNLQVYFERQGAALTPSQNGADYLPGDIVTWMLPGNKPHIGIVSSEKNNNNRYDIVHNIGYGPMSNDMLFDYPITGHYRYLPEVGSL